MVTPKWRCSKILIKFGFKSCFQVDAKDWGKMTVFWANTQRIKGANDQVKRNESLDVQ